MDKDKMCQFNQADCFSLLYLHLSRSLRETCGRGAEGAVREAVRRAGASLGRCLREGHVDAGVPADLLSLFGSLEGVGDPRLQRVVREDNAEMRLWEVRSCPLADVWIREEGCREGVWFCEEWLAALLGGYTCGKGQANVSNYMTHKRDSHCCLSAYYRGANTDGAQRAQSFCRTPGSAMERTPSGEVEDQAAALYVYILETARERFGREGECAVALGLRDFREHILARPVGVALGRDGYPFAPGVREHPIWRGKGGREALELLRVNLLDPIGRRLEPVAAQA